ncbi:energy transducer TonB [Natronogracilivirga saccharolytica]|uniref:Energy transducer TonB n=1 Tax=Natronogracilivirga saccharolytica TaxID=2812953 RepID=A0A8J7RPE8_9BACT|nr:energy transducer TonB [Natronogracilivirga saccharolytica]MBP3191429.1 energy transducer TonB [Natronogracilivirga saccharolytica]
MSILENKKPNVNLHKYYMINLQIGFIVTLIILIALFRIDLQPGSEFEIQEEEQEIIEMEEIIQTEQETTPPPPPRPPSPEPVPDDEIVEDQFYDLDTEVDLDAPMDMPPPPPPEDDEEEEEPEVFTIVEDMPELKGGMQAIYDNLEYPEIARQAGIEGRVVVQFIIDEEGQVVDPQVVRGIGGGCDEAAVEAVKQVEFTPGRQRGRPVRVRYSLPITFRLSQ